MPGNRFGSRLDSFIGGIGVDVFRNAQETNGRDVDPVWKAAKDTVQEIAPDIFFAF